MTSISRSGLAALRACVTLDLRSLALFRVLLALVLICDGLLRALDASLLYTDAGLYPRLLAISLGEPARLSLHLLNGSAVFAVLLCLLQSLAGLALLAGWQARKASLLALVLLISAGARTPLAITPGDLLLQALLLWGCFLPWQARWSLQPAAPELRTETSWASAALVLQILVIATALALQAQAPLAARLLAASLALLLMVPLPQARIAAVVLLQMAALMALSAGLGLGSALLLAATGLALLDSGAWDRLQRLALRQQPAGELRLYYRDALPGAPRVLELLRELLILPRCRVLPASASPRVERLLGANRQWLLIDHDDSAQLGEDAAQRLRERALLLRPLRRVLPSWLLNADRIDAWLQRPAPALRVDPPPSLFTGGGPLVLVLASLMLLSHLGGLLGLPLAPSWLLQPLALDQRWTLAAPERRGWLVFAGETAGGQEVDPLRAPQAVRDADPAAPLLSDARNRAYLDALAAPGAAPSLHEAASAYLCRINAAPAGNDRALLRVRIVEMLPGESTEAVAEQRVLWRQDCP